MERACGSKASVQALRTGGGKNAGAVQCFDAGCERNLTGNGCLRKHCGNDLLVFLWLKRTGGVDNAAPGTNSPQCGLENGALTLSLTGKILRAQAMAYLRVAAQRASTAAGNIRQRKIEGCILGERGSVGKPALDARGMRRETQAQLREALGTGLTGQYASLRMACGENERLAAGRSAGIYDPSCFLPARVAAAGGQFGNEL